MLRVFSPGGTATRTARCLAPMLLTAACTLPIDPVASGIAAPSRFVASADSVPADAPDPVWWRRFGAPELDRLMEAAMLGNRDIAASVARLRQADAQLRIASSQLLPFVEASGSVARSRGTSINPGTAGNAGWRYSGLVAASYEVDFWGRLRAQQQAARDTVVSTTFDIGTVALTTQSGVASTLFDLLGTREQLRIQRTNLEIAERVLGILRQRLAVGTATGLDVAQQEAVAAQQRGQIPVLERVIDADGFALATLAGLRPEDVTIGEQELTDIRVPAIEPGLPAVVLARRPDLRAAEAALAASSADVTAARGALFPTIVLTGEGGLQSIALQTLLRPGSTIYTLALGISRPLFDGGRLRAELEFARGREHELLANYQRAILAALQDAETSLSAVQRNTELVALQEVREEAASRAFAIADAQFRAGTIDLLTVLNTQTTLFTARLALAQARTARLQAAAALFAALGGGWTPEMVRGPEAIAAGGPR
jgi:outer membrane protein, multidrug efflux system